jgi:hypothetical protein
LWIIFKICIGRFFNFLTVKLFLFFFLLLLENAREEVHDLRSDDSEDLKESRVSKPTKKAKLEPEVVFVNSVSDDELLASTSSSSFSSKMTPKMKLKQTFLDFTSF